jgi:integrase/recombinase XerD
LYQFEDYLKTQRVTIPTQITQRHVDGFVLWCHARHLKPSSVHTYVAAMMALLKWLPRAGYVSPTTRFEKPKTPTVRHTTKFTLDEAGVNLFVNHCRSEDEPYRTMFVLMAATGLRVNEALALPHDSIETDSANAAVYLRMDSEKSKGDVERRIPVLSFAYPYLRNYLHAYFRPLVGGPDKASGRPLFLLSDGQIPPTYTMTQVVMNRLATKMGLKGKLTSHTLRRSYATFLYGRGVGPKEMQAIMGHASFATTSLYLKITNADLAKVLEKAAWTPGL